MEEYISRMEHEEFRRSMDLANKNLEDENRRQNKRLENLEENAKQNTELVTNVGRLAVNMKNRCRDVAKDSISCGYGNCWCCRLLFSYAAWHVRV